MIEKIKAFFRRLWAMCFHSATIAWSYILGVVGGIFDNIDAVASAMGDPNLNQQINAVVGDAKLIGKWLLTVAIVNVIARARSMVKKN